MYGIVPWVLILHPLWVIQIQAVFIQRSPYPCSWNTEMCTESLHASSRASLYHFKNAFPFLHVLLTCLFRWNMSTGKRTTFVQCIEHLGKHSTIWSSVHRKPLRVFFNGSIATTIREAVNKQHSTIFSICEDVWCFSDRSYSHYQRSNWCFRLINMFQTVLQYGRREGQYLVPNQNYCTVK